MQILRMLAEEHRVGFAMECGVQRWFINERAQYSVTGALQGRPRVGAVSASGHPRGKKISPGGEDNLISAPDDYVIGRSDIMPIRASFFKSFVVF